MKFVLEIGIVVIATVLIRAVTAQQLTPCQTELG